MKFTEKQIGENTFYIKPFPAFVAANISGDLAAVITPMIGSLAPLFADQKGEGRMTKRTSWMSRWKMLFLLSPMPSPVWMVINSSG